MEPTYANQTLLTGLTAIAGFNALLVCFILLFSAERRTLANKLLSLSLFGFGVIALMLFLIETGIILSIPWLFRLPSPLYYTIFPAAYLYVRLTIADRSYLKYYEWALFIPAFVHLLEFLPYYLQSVEYKKAHLLSQLTDPAYAYAHNEGFFSDFIHNLIRGAMSLTFGLLMVREITVNGRKRGSSQIKHLNPWLWGFSLFLVFFGLVIIYGLMPGVTWETISRGTFLNMWIALLLLTTSVQLIFSPSILYGLPLPGASGTVSNRPAENIPPTNTGSGQTTGSVITSEHISILKFKLEEFMQTHKPYLKQRYSAADLARDLGVPRHHLGYLFSEVYKVRFNDFINEWRIRHLEDRYKTEGGQLTLEALALDSGFSNRETFIRSFKRIKGKTPTDYFKQ